MQNSEEYDSDSEEEDEPRLKYQRVSGNVPNLLQVDHASAMAVTDKLLVVGTQLGVIYVLDVHGHEYTRFQQHSAAINELSIDDKGEYVASCSNEGRVVITGIVSNERFEFEYGHPMLAVAIKPVFDPKKPAFVCGGKGGQLVYNRKGWFKNQKTVLHSGEGAIYAIAWRGTLIAWANDIGIKIFDTQYQERITYIERPRGSPRPDQYRCTLCWESDTQIIIGWADSVKIGRVRDRKGGEQSQPGMPHKYVEIIAMFQTDFFISGIAPFGEDLVILAPGDEEDEEDHPPDLSIFSRNGDEIITDTLPIRGFEHCTSYHYRLIHSTVENLFYVVSPKDVVLARPRDRDDHIQWMLEHERFEDALEAAEGHERDLRTFTFVDIGKRYIDHLLHNRKIDKAASVCPRIFKNDATLWEPGIHGFARMGHIRAIAPYIPIANPKLDFSVYTVVLEHFLAIMDYAQFLKIIREWPHDIYDINATIASVEQRFKEGKGNRTLQEALAQLFSYSKQYNRTLLLLLQIRSKRVFELIETQNLFNSITDKVADIMAVDTKKAVELLTNNLAQMPPSRVVEQLVDHPKYQLQYLHHVRTTKKELSTHLLKPFHNMMLDLYAQHDPEHLSAFLEQSSFVDLDKALKMCKDRSLWKEMVSILGRMGNAPEALNLLIEKIGDVKKAVEFVERQNEPELWDELIAKSIKNPQFVSNLLEHVGAHINPLQLIKRIPKGMEIIGLRDRLVKIIYDYNLQTSLLKGCKEVLKSDCVELAARLNEESRCGIRVEPGVRCATSNEPIFDMRDKPSMADKRLVVFFDKTVHYEDALRQHNQGRNKTTTPDNKTFGRGNARK